MRETFLLFLMLILTILNAEAQDVIKLTNGKQIQAKVLEIRPSRIEYTDHDNPDGTITIARSTVASIQYANGTKTIFNEPDSTGSRKKSRNVRLRSGFFLGEFLAIGGSNTTHSDMSYSTYSDLYAGLNYSATWMFSEHIGIQSGFGLEIYSYKFSDDRWSDVFSLRCFTLPVRAIYFSNSKKSVGLYATGGGDISFRHLAVNSRNYLLTSYYSSVFVSPNISSGFALKFRNGRIVLMFGLYYKTSLINCYSGNTDDNGWLKAGNTGAIHSAGLASSVMLNFGRRR